MPEEELNNSLTASVKENITNIMEEFKTLVRDFHADNDNSFEDDHKFP